ncbi:MAG: shikimate kinase [Gemmatimonadaceae bacterium]
MATPVERHLVLVGLPGAGKSTVGKLVARRLARAFVDLDDEIVRHSGMTVAELFARQGESHFRQLEESATARIPPSPVLVIAPGGGWIANERAVATLRARASIIYLRVHPATALARLKNDMTIRPLIAGANPLETLDRLLDARRLKYEAANATVDTDGLDADEVALAIVRIAAG